MLRTKGAILRTGRKAARGLKSVRPFELYFLGAIAGAGGLLPAGSCGSETAATPPAPAVIEAVSTAPATQTPTPDLFATSVRPVLVARCAPCHDPGGKLYAKLPFDNATVVADHSAGILRRLRGEDAAVIERWVAALPRSRASTP